MMHPMTNQKFVLVASGKGGVGKSTTAVHLAYLLDGVLIDLDPKQGTRFYKDLKSPVLSKDDPIPDDKTVVIDPPASAELVAQYAREFGPLITHVVIPMQPTAEDYVLAQELMEALSKVGSIPTGVILTFLGNDKDSKVAPEIVKDVYGWDLIGQVRYRQALYRNIRTSGINSESAEPYWDVARWVLSS